MSTNNALCFISVGLMMCGLPTLTPEMFPPHVIYGSNTSALWLAFMGIVNGVVGAGFLVSNEVWSLVRPALEWPPQPAIERAPTGVVLRPGILTTNQGRDSGANEAAA